MFDGKMKEDKQEPFSIWKQFSEEMKGKYIEWKYYHSDKTEIEYENWKIIFDNYTAYATVGTHTYDQKYTRVVAPVTSIDNFRFEIFPENLISSAGKIFGAQDVKVGLAEIDNNYIIKTNNESKIKTLLNAYKLRSLFASLENINLQTSDQKGIWEEKLPDKQLELSLFVKGSINEIETLKIIYRLFSELLNELYHLKSIEQISPPVFKPTYADE